MSSRISLIRYHDKKNGFSPISCTFYSDSRCAVKWSDLARDPHARYLQPCCVPFEVISTTTDIVDAAPAACPVPESSAVVLCAVVVVPAASPRFVVSVVRGEHHSILIAKCIIAGVARVARHLKRVVAWLSKNSEPAVLGPVYQLRLRSCSSNLSL